MIDNQHCGEPFISPPLQNAPQVECSAVSNDKRTEPPTIKLLLEVEKKEFISQLKSDFECWGLPARFTTLQTHNGSQYSAYTSKMWKFKASQAPAVRIDLMKKKKTIGQLSKTGIISPFLSERIVYSANFKWEIKSDGFYSSYFYF